MAGDQSRAPGARGGRFPPPGSPSRPGGESPARPRPAPPGSCPTTRSPRPARRGRACGRASGWCGTGGSRRRSPCPGTSRPGCCAGGRPAGPTRSGPGTPGRSRPSRASACTIRGAGRGGPGGAEGRVAGVDRDRHHLAVLGADHDARATVGHEGARQPAPEEDEDPQPHEDGDTEDQLKGGGHGESPLVRVYASADSKEIVRLIPSRRYPWSAAVSRRPSPTGTSAGCGGRVAT